MKIFIGYDGKEQTAFHVLAHSIMRRSAFPVSITALVRDQLRVFFTRGRGPLESTDFSMTRFLVPYLSGYTGYSVFMDCDMLCLANIKDLWKYVDEDRAVWVAQHDYTPKTGLKMDNQVQTAYPRKNWSSVMVFNNARCRALTPDYVNTASGLDLHRFAWIKDQEYDIGSLPLEWNWLVGEYPANLEAKVLHYTLGGPWLPAYRRCDHAGDWYDEYRHMTDRDYWPRQVWQMPKPPVVLHTEAKK